MCYLIKVFCKTCKRWIEKNSLRLYELGFTNTICLPRDAKLVLIFKFSNGIKLVNLSNAPILKIRNQRYLKIDEILNIEKQKNKSCLKCANLMVC